MSMNSRGIERRGLGVSGSWGVPRMVWWGIAWRKGSSVSDEKDYFGREGDDEWAILGWRPPLWLHIAFGVFVGTIAASFVLSYLWAGWLQQALREGLLR